MANESYKARSCLFCDEETSSLPSEIEIKEDEETGGVDNLALNTQSWKVPTIVKEQLKPIFIVRKLLDIPEEKCAEYLQHNDNENGSESEAPNPWFDVCKRCDSTVEESYKVYREIKRLECNLESLKVKLKHSILRVRINEDTNGSRRTRGKIELGKARDFIHVDIRKFVTEENVYILPDQELPVMTTQQTVERVNRKRRNQRKTSKITTACDFPDSYWQVDSPVDDFHHTTDLDSEWQPISNQESDHLPLTVKVDGDEYDSDYTPSLKIRKRKSRCKTTAKTQRHRKRKGNDGETEQVTEKKDGNAKKPVRPVYVQRCKLCVAVFRSLKFFEQHKTVHASGAGFPCLHCGWLCHTKSGLKSHLSQKHNKSDPRRRKKKKRREIKYNFEDLEAIPYYCDHCHMIYTSEASLLRHILIFHKNIVHLTCNFCDSTFPTKQLLELHHKEQHPSSSETGDDDVPAKEIKEESQMCEHCSKSFSSKLKRDLHIATDHRDVLLTCKTCGFKAAIYSRLVEHNLMKHDQRNQQHMCEHCPKAFTTTSYLNAHLKATHFDLLGNDPVICMECNVTFPYAAALLDHENYVHKKIKGRCCEYCGKAFSRGCDLKRHILLHTTTREEQYKKGPFYCQFCQAKFNVRQALYYHLKKHHTDKYAHKCDYCGTGYVTQNTLLQHLRKCKAKKQRPAPSTQTPPSPPSSAATIDVSVKQEGNIMPEMLLC